MLNRFQKNRSSHTKRYWLLRFLTLSIRCVLFANYNMRMEIYGELKKDIGWILQKLCDEKAHVAALFQIFVHGVFYNTHDHIFRFFRERILEHDLCDELLEYFFTH